MGSQSDLRTFLTHLPAVDWVGERQVALTNLVAGESMEWRACVLRGGGCLVSI